MREKVDYREKREEVADSKRMSVNESKGVKLWWKNEGTVGRERVSVRRPKKSAVYSRLKNVGYLLDGEYDNWANDRGRKWITTGEEREIGDQQQANAR